MHNPSTHRSSNSGHGDECDVEAAFTVSIIGFAVVVSSMGFCVVAGLRIVLRNRLGVLTVDELIVALGLTKIGTTPSPVDTIRSPSESLWSCSEFDAAS